MERGTSIRSNLLLSTLSEDDRLLLAPVLEQVGLEQNQFLSHTNQPIEYVYFPEGGVMSIVAVTPGDGRTEVGIFGSEGMSGLPVVLGTDASPHEVFVQVDGTTAQRIRSDDLRRAMRESPSLQNLLLRYVQAFLVQSSYTTASNAHHLIEARLARWLLMCHDRIEGDEIRLTHEFMSMMIAAQRTGVTLTLHILEGAGMIRSKRSRVQILDREKLDRPRRRRLRPTGGRISPADRAVRPWQPSRLTDTTDPFTETTGLVRAHMAPLLTQTNSTSGL